MVQFWLSLDGPFLLNKSTNDAYRYYDVCSSRLRHNSNPEKNHRQLNKIIIEMSGVLVILLPAHAVVASVWAARCTSRAKCKKNSLKAVITNSSGDQPANECSATCTAISSPVKVSDVMKVRGNLSCQCDTFCVISCDLATLSFLQILLKSVHKFRKRFGTLFKLRSRFHCLISIILSHYE